MGISHRLSWLLTGMDQSALAGQLMGAAAHAPRLDCVRGGTSSDVCWPARGRGVRVLQFGNLFICLSSVSGLPSGTRCPCYVARRVLGPVGHPPHHPLTHMQKVCAP